MLSTLSSPVLNDGACCAFLVNTERFNRTVRYEWLSEYYWSSIEEVQDFATKWMWPYKHDQPEHGPGRFPPKAASGHGCVTVLFLRAVDIGGLPWDVR